MLAHRILVARLAALAAGTGIAACSPVARDEEVDQGADALARGRPALTHGTLVGAVTPRGARISVRVEPEAEVEIECSSDPLFLDPWTCSTSAARTLAERDFTAILAVEGLRPDSTHHYRVVIDGRPAPPETHGRFATFPEGHASEVTIGLLADSICQAPAPQLEHLAADEPDLVVVLGDYPHANAVTLPTMRHMRRCVRSRTSELGADFVEQVASRFPVAYPWDDHDYCASDSGAECEVRDLAVRVHDEYWPAYEEGRPDEGIWHSFAYGDLVEVFVLDLRFNRTADTLLGEAQRDWLESALRRSTARWKVVVSTVTFNSTTRKHDLETWASFDGEHDRNVERRWLVDLVEEVDPDHTVFVSGDIHSGGALDDGLYSGFPEISVPSTNTPINTCTFCYTAEECDRDRACGLWSDLFVERGVGYGVITATHGGLTMSVRGVRGQELGSTTLLAD